MTPSKTKKIDMLKSLAAIKELVPEIERSTNQFLRDLLLTGSAVMPDGEVVLLYPSPSPPPSPLSDLTLC